MKEKVARRAEREPDKTAVHRTKEDVENVKIETQAKQKPMTRHEERRVSRTKAKAQEGPQRTEMRMIIYRYLLASLSERPALCSGSSHLLAIFKESVVILTVPEDDDDDDAQPLHPSANKTFTSSHKETAKTKTDKKRKGG